MNEKDFFDMIKKKMKAKMENLEKAVSVFDLPKDDDYVYRE
ncbi:MAG: hypothetical protein ACTTKN_09530 [Phocaeicola sp.]